MTIKMDREELQAFLDRDFPQVAGDFRIGETRPGRITVWMDVTEKHLRPGGTVSGPSMFALADVSVYLAILSMVGKRPLAVTTNCSIDFMRRPAADAPLRSEARMLKLGRVLAVGDVLIFSEGMEAPVARATLTYSIPPVRH